MLRIEIAEDTDRPALRALSHGLIDLATTVELEDNTLEFLPLAHDHLIALVRENDPLARLPSLDAHALANRPFILTRGGSEPLLRIWFAHSALEPLVHHKIQQITTILAMVRAGMGVAVIAEMAMPETHEGVISVPLFPSSRAPFALQGTRVPFRCMQLNWFGRLRRGGSGTPETLGRKVPVGLQRSRAKRWIKGQIVRTRNPVQAAPILRRPKSHLGGSAPAHLHKTGSRRGSSHSKCPNDAARQPVRSCRL